MPVGKGKKTKTLETYSTSYGGVKQKAVAYGSVDDRHIANVLVASFVDGAKAIAASRDQQYGSVLSSVGSTLLLTTSNAFRNGRLPLVSENGEPVIVGPNISKAKRRFFLAIFLCLFFIGAALFSVPAPFFPTRAMEKGMSQTTAGFVLGSMQLVQFIAAIGFAVTMFHFGLKFMLCFGILWASSCAVLFGLLDLGPNDTSYTTLCFVVRLVQGIGVSAYFISSSTITAVLFSENYAFTIGLLQTFYSLGCLAGPSIGGALYGVGGYICPFVVMGFMLMIFAPIVAVTVPNGVCSPDAAGQSHENPVRVFKAMLTPGLFALFYTMLAGTMTTVFTETTLGVRLAQFGITDPMVVGAVYLSSSGAYGLTAPIAGHITDKHDAGWMVMFIGTLLAILGYIIIGPCPLLESLFLPAGLPQLIIGSFVAHCGIASCLIPMTRELQRVAGANGLDKEHPSTLSFISAFFDSCWGIGGFLGAFLAGFLMENLGFGWATTCQALVLVPSIFFQLFLMLKFGHISNCFAKQNGYIEI